MVALPIGTSAAPVTPASHPPRTGSDEPSASTPSPCRIVRRVQPELSPSEFEFDFIPKALLEQQSFRPATGQKCLCSFCADRYRSRQDGTAEMCGHVCQHHGIATKGPRLRTIVPRRGFVQRLGKWAVTHCKRIAARA